MKRLFTQKAKPTNPCPVDSLGDLANLSQKVLTEDTLVSNEGNRRAFTSAAMIGLAISMGATGVLLPSQSDEAVAAESSLADTLSTPEEVDSGSTTPDWETAAVSTQEEVENLSVVEETEEALVESQDFVVQPTLEIESEQEIAKVPQSYHHHEVKSGETLWQISKAYQVTPEAIAASNQIAPTSNLSVGQSLDIPETNGIVHQVEASETVASLSQDYGIESEEIESSVAEGELVTIPGEVDTLLKNKQETALENLKQEQGKLKDSLAKLQTDQEPTEQIKAPQIAASPSTLQEPQSVIIPVPQPENSVTVQPEAASQVPVAIPVPTPQAQPEAESEVATETPVVVPPVTVATEATKVHRVRPGETVDEIARQYGLSLTELVEANQLDNPNRIVINQAITIPNPQIARSARQSLDNSTVAVNTLPGVTSNKPEDTVEEVEVNQSPLQQDIVRLQAQYQPQQQVNTLVASAETSSRTEVAAQINTEWQTDRSNGQVLVVEVQDLRENVISRQPVQKPILSDISSIPVPTSTEKTEKVEVTAPTANSLSPISVQKPNANAAISIPVTLPVQEEEETVVAEEPKTVAVAPAPADTYNSLLKPPVGEVVSPDLPPLAAPDEYLPDSPDLWNGRHSWPAKGVLTSGYGMRWGRMHKGIDIAAPTGTPIVASGPGEVITAGWNSGGYGNLVEIRHPDGTMTRYGHNSRVVVRSGQKVEQGQHISDMGSTGYSTGPHLHFEVHPGGKSAVNPMAYLQKR
ncbi:MAG: peptidoglycan DD-metalloendopeptidase family protein [Spirulinaceae cyanobacterium]